MDNQMNFNCNQTYSKIPILNYQNKWMIFIVLSLVIYIYLLVRKISFNDNPILYIIAIILGIQGLIFSLLSLNSKKVISLLFIDDYLNVEYIKGYSTLRAYLPINSTEIELFELKNGKSFFVGLQINLINKSERQKLKIMNSFWSYEDIERIYTEFKRRKNEEIPSNEISVFKELQIMNSTN